MNVKKQNFLNFPLGKRLLIGMILVLMLAVGVSAASISVDKVTIDKSVKPTGSFSDTFTINNNGTTSITDLKIQLGGTELSGFNVSTLPYSLGSAFSLANGSSVTITLTGTVPDDIVTKETAYSAPIKIYSGSTELASINLNIVAESQLELDNVKFLIDGKSKSISEGDTRSDVLPGSKLEIKGDITNKFSDDDDIEMQDVTIEITLESIDNEGDDDLDGDEDIGDIKADDEESFSIEFEIPEDVDEGEYDVVILVEGEDENGAKHSVEWTDVRLKVEKDKHDIQITKVSVSPSKISCSRRASVNVDLKNQGTSDEDEVVVLIESADLEIVNEDSTIPELQEGTGEDTEYDKAYSFDIADNVRAGTYQLSVKVFYGTDTLSDSETVDLVVEKCEVSVPVEDDKKDDAAVVVVSPPKTVIKEDQGEDLDILTTPVTETTEGSSLLGSGNYMLLLLGAIGIAVIVIIIMVVVLFSMKRKVE